MQALHQLKRQYALKQITEEEYKKKEERYIMILIDMVYEGIISMEELHKRITE